jgi:hypothetical protein
MERPGFQLTLAALLGLVACIALNLWLFRFGVLAGLIGLNISKHVLIASLCQKVGVDRRKTRESGQPASTLQPHMQVR